MLARIRKAMEEKDEGFTLIELLVVMIIIGILAAIAIPVFLSQKKKGYEASEKSDLRSIATEISTQLVDNPTAVVLGGGVAPVGGGPVSNVSVTPTPGTAGTVNLSPNNTMVKGTVSDVTNGVYCVQLHNSKAASASDTSSDWKISKADQNSSQVLAQGTCP